MSLQYSKRRKTVRITVTAEAQKLHFGGSLVGKRVDVMIGRDGDRGRIRVCVAKDGAFECRKSVRDTVYIAINRWNLLPEDKRPAQMMRIASADDAGVTLMVPDYKRVAPVQNGGGKASETQRRVDLGGGKSIAVPKATPMA